MASLQDIIEVQMDLMFCAIADDKGLISGDVSPEQSLELDDIKAKLLVIARQYVKNNK
jgi:hypothetical protein